MYLQARMFTHKLCNHGTPPHTHNTPRQAHPHNNTRIQNIPQNQQSPPIPYYLTPLHDTLIIGISHLFITKHTHPSSTSKYPVLATHNSHLSKHNTHQCQPSRFTLFSFYCLIIILYLFYNNTNIPTIWPSPLIHKLPRTSHQQISTQPRIKIKIKAFTTLIKHHLISTPRISKLITLSLTVIFFLNLNLHIHQAHSLLPQHIHPTNPTTTWAPYRTLCKLHLHKNLTHHPKPPLITQTHFHSQHDITFKHIMASASRPRHNVNIKNRLSKNGEARETTTNIPNHERRVHFLSKQPNNSTPILQYDTHPTHKLSQPYLQYVPQPKHKPHSNHNTHPRTKMHSKHKAHLKTKPYHLKNMHPQHKHHPKHYIHLKGKIQSNVKTNLLHNLHPELKNELQPNTHTLYKHTTKNKMASAYRPRLTYHNTCIRINYWKPNSMTNHQFTNNTQSHFSPKQIEKPIPAIPNLFTTTKYTLIIYLKTHMKKPKTILTHGHYFINKLELLKCGDIESNPGPMPNILHSHPTTHKRRANIYFIPNTIKLQPEYQHLANTFAPILKNTHSLYPQTINTYPHLHQYIQTQRQSPPTHLLYALIITIHPLIDTCNHILAQPQNFHFNNIWTNTLIIRLANLHNPPERHIMTPHPYTTFIENNQDIILPQNSIHTKIYEFIHNQDTPPLQQSFKINSPSSQIN